MRFSVKARKFQRFTMENKRGRNQIMIKDFFTQNQIFLAVYVLGNKMPKNELSLTF